MLNVRTELRGRGPSRVSHLLRSAYKLFLISLTNIFPRQACTASPTSTRRRCRCCRRPRWPGSGASWARTNPSPSLCSAELPFCRNWGGKKARKKSHLGMNHIHVNRDLCILKIFSLIQLYSFSFNCHCCWNVDWNMRIVPRKLPLPEIFYNNNELNELIENLSDKEEDTPENQDDHER